jgi:cytochrome b involved in lipid metabolism
MSKSFSAAEVAKHKTEDDGVWLIIDGGVYDVTSTPPPSLWPPHFSSAQALLISSLAAPQARGLTERTEFMDDHPGGSKILKRMGGKDASKQFWKYHNDKVLAKYGDKLKIGSVEEKAKL